MAGRITIKHIAELSGVSTTTVYKALNRKTKISEDVRKQIMDIAEKTGYVPNRSAQALARKILHIGVLLCNYPAEYQCYIHRGCQDAFDYYRDYHIEAKIVIYPQLDSWDDIRHALKSFIDDGIDGIIIEPGYYFDKYEDLLRMALERNIPVVTLASDTSIETRTGSVSIDSKVAGQMAAQFLKKVVPKNSSVVIFTGKKSLSIHQFQIAGFSKTAQQLGLEVAGIFETNEQYDLAYSLTERVLNEIPNLGGICVSSYNSVGVCDCLKAQQKNGEIHVIGQDLYQKLIDCLYDGSLDATLFQNPRQQAYRAVDMIISRLTIGILPNSIERITPQLIMTSNLECYLKDITN